MTTTPARSATILFAEDDDLVRQIAEETLRVAGYEVVSVGDGEEAWEALARVQPDLILSDVRMPRCNGFELLQRVRRDAAYTATPFIIMSAKADTADQRMGMSLGADDYVTKPYQPDDLLKTIAMRLTRAAMVNDVLRQQQRFLARVLPHELRTPLSGIIGYADLMTDVGLAGETLTPTELVDYGRNLQRSGSRLLRIAEDFSLWSWFEAQAAAVRRGAPPLLATMGVIADEVRHWSEKNAEEYGRIDDLVVDVEGAVIQAPVEGFARVVLHLVDNAFKFSLPGTTVRVAGAKVGADYVLTITDHGRGMSAEELKRVGMLRQFGRDTFEQQGLGMGLVLARSFARLGGGEFSLADNQPESGLTARLVLPQAEA